MLVDFNRDESKNLPYQREGIEKRNRAIREILERLNWNGEEPLIYLTLHGAKDERINSYGGDFAVGTVNNRTCPEWVALQFKEDFSKALQVSRAPNRGLLNREAPFYSGHPSLVKLKELFGENFLLIQLELSLTLRRDFTQELISSLFLTLKGLLRGRK